MKAKRRIQMIVLSAVVLGFGAGWGSATAADTTKPGPPRSNAAAGSPAGLLAPGARVRARTNYVLKVGDSRALFASQVRFRGTHVRLLGCATVTKIGGLRCANIARVLQASRSKDPGVRFTCGPRSGMFLLRLRARVTGTGQRVAITRTVSCTGYP